jgi:uncharacterized protein YndB with AHSA1/START domain
MTKKKTPGDAASREIRITRVIDAPRERVWEAFADPKQVAQWWGPSGFKTTTDQREFKVGGTWRHTMIGPDGAEYPNLAQFEEIVKPERVVFANGGGKDGGRGVQFRSTWTFKDLGGKTEVSIHMVFTAASDRDFVVQEHGAIEGGKQTLSRLESLLKGEFVITRLFDAPRELVWKAWTEPSRMAAWFGPKGLKPVSATLDLRPGGVYHYGMSTPDGKEMWGKWTFREIAAPERLVFVNAFSDANQGITRHPMSPTWPLETLSTVLFDDMGGKTLLTLKWAPLHASDVERKTFDEGRESMNKGWGGTLERLTEHLAEHAERRA